MNFAVSTTAFRGMSAEAIIGLAKENDLQIEFSSGLPHREDMEEVFLGADCKRLPHNYFPAPRVPFVLNLASLDESLFQRSVDHCRQGLRLASNVGAPFYSVHAGFCMDPHPKTLGKPFELTYLHPREDHWKQFMKGLSILLPEAEKFGVDFLVENNVLAPFNYNPTKPNPLLCADAQELIRMMNAWPETRLGILIDTGHLRVSAKTLGFSEVEALRQVRQWVKAFHHSDNTGAEDTNEPLSETYWFLKEAPAFKNAFHILEVHFQSLSEIQRQFDLIRKASQAVA